MPEAPRMHVPSHTGFQNKTLIIHDHQHPLTYRPGAQHQDALAGADPAAAAGVHPDTQGLAHGAQLIVHALWQLEAVVGWVVHILRVLVGTGMVVVYRSCGTGDS